MHSILHPVDFKSRIPNEMEKVCIAELTAKLDSALFAEMDADLNVELIGMQNADRQMTGCTC